MQKLLYLNFPFHQGQRMPRSSRLDAPGVLHHEMGRGIEKKEIFIDNKDREDFANRLAALADDDSMDIYAFALLPNHFHLLVTTPVLKTACIIRQITCRFEAKLPYL